MKPSLTISLLMLLPILGFGQAFGNPAMGRAKNQNNQNRMVQSNEVGLIKNKSHENELRTNEIFLEKEEKSLEKF